MWAGIDRGKRSSANGRAAMSAGAWLLAGLFDCAAADPSPPSPNNSGREVWAGADVSSNVWLVYSGVTFAPWSGIHQDGFRFRAAGGYGEYQYSDRVPYFDLSGGTTRAVEFRAETYFSDLLVGYQKRFGELTAKGFVGVAAIGHDISPTDEETIAIGDEVGIKGVVELWLNIGQNAWGSLDLSWASAHNTRAARARLGYRVWPKLSMGLEAGVNVDAQGECRISSSGTGGCKLTDDQRIDPAGLLDYARAGTFVRYEWGASEVSLSSGVLGDSFSSDSKVEIAPYVTVNWLTQF